MNSDCGDNMCSEKENTGGGRAVRGGLARAGVPTRHSGAVRPETRRPHSRDTSSYGHIQRYDLILLGSLKSRTRIKVINIEDEIFSLQQQRQLITY